MTRLLAAVLGAALISALIDPGLGLDLESLATYLGFLLALGVVLISFELPALLVHRRRMRETGQLRVLPWTLVVAGIFVLISRLADLHPGYLYGLVLGVVFLRQGSPADEGREQAYGAVATLLIALGAWLLLGVLRGAGLPEDGFATIVLETGLAAIVVAGLEAVAFGLMPMRFMPGRAVYAWSRLGWAVLWGLSLFTFIYVLIGPNTGYLSSLSPGAWLAALGVFTAFGAFSVGFWAYFRFRPARREA